MLTTFQKCELIREYLVRKVSEVIVYADHWGDQFCMSELLEIPTSVLTGQQDGQDWHIDPTDLTTEEMDKLGFGKFDENSTGRLIPIWVYPFMVDEVKLTSINGDQVIKKSEMNTDTRFGFLAYEVKGKK